MVKWPIHRLDLAGTFFRLGPFDGGGENQSKSSVNKKALHAEKNYRTPISVKGIGGKAAGKYVGESKESAIGKRKVLRATQKKKTGMGDSLM